MRSMIVLTVAAMVLALSMTAGAELQNVELDGTLLIRGNYLDMGDDYTETWIEQRTTVGVLAEFTDNVSAYIEFDNYSVWGEDFRSMDWESGFDNRATIEYGMEEDMLAEVEVYQAYIQALDMWGTPLDLTVGRQELVFGSEWLMGNNSTGYSAWGLSWDALRLDYNTDMFSVTAVAAKHQEDVFGDLFEEDGNLYMLYSSFTGMEDIVIDGYFIYVEDDEDDEKVWTAGLRAAGAIAGFDFDAEAAFQDQNEGLMDDEFFAATLEVGYTLDVAWTPRMYLGAAYIEEHFHRLFSDVQYTQIFDDQFKNGEDIIVYRGGVEVQPTESIAAGLDVSYIQEEDTEDSRDTRGFEVAVDATYNYTEDLSFTILYAHLFSDTEWDDDDYDLASVMTSIRF